MTAQFRDGKWCVDFRFGGERIRRTSPEQSKRGAERFEKALKKRLEQGLPIGDDESEQPQPRKEALPTFKEFAEMFMETHAPVHNSASEIASKRNHLDAHLLPAFGRVRLDELHMADIEKFKAKLLTGKTRHGKQRSKKTVNNILSTFSKILSYAVQLGTLEHKPRIEPLKVDEVAPKFLDCAEYERLVEAAASYGDPIWHAAILLGGDAGLRLGEIRALRPEHRHEDRIMVQRAFWMDVEKGTKGKRLRTVPLSDRLQAVLVRLESRGHRYVISPRSLTPITKEIARWHLPKIYKLAGLKPIGWHVLRHTFCSHLAMAGVPARTIQELAGHTDLATTLRYMHLMPGATDLAVRALAEHRNQAQQTEMVTKNGQMPENDKA